MEFLRNFIMTGIRDMIKRDVALYQTYQYASGWFAKGVLTQADLEEISSLYEEKERIRLEEISKAEETSTTEPVIEEAKENIESTEENPIEETTESEE